MQLCKTSTTTVTTTTTTTTLTMMTTTTTMTTMITRMQNPGQQQQQQQHYEHQYQLITGGHNMKQRPQLKCQNTSTSASFDRKTRTKEQSSQGHRVVSFGSCTLGSVDLHNKLLVCHSWDHRKPLLPRSLARLTVRSSFFWLAVAWLRSVVCCVFVGLCFRTEGINLPAQLWEWLLPYLHFWIIRVRSLSVQGQPICSEIRSRNLFQVIP